MYPKETALIDHYDSNVEYYSSPASVAFDRLGVAIKGAVVIDFGCGDGRVCRELLKRGATYCTGVDYSAARITAARAESKDSIDFHCGNLHEYLDTAVAEAVEVDLVCLFEVLEHLEDPRSVLDRVAKIASAVCGSVPLRHEYVAHLQVFDTIDDIVDLVGKDAIFTVADGHVFFYKQYK